MPFSVRTRAASPIAASRGITPLMACEVNVPLVDATRCERFLVEVDPEAGRIGWCDAAIDEVDASGEEEIPQRVAGDSRDVHQQRVRQRGGEVDVKLRIAVGRDGQVVGMRECSDLHEFCDTADELCVGVQYRG